MSRMPYRPMPCEVILKIISDRLSTITLSSGLCRYKLQTAMSAITRSSSEDDELQMALNAKHVNKSNSLLNGYEILRILGKGNYGSVVLASRPLLDPVGSRGDFSADKYNDKIATKSLCVIKSVKHTRKRDGANVDAIKEVHILKDLKHPCIVEYIDSFFNEAETRLFIVMAYCDSGNLSDRIKSAIEKQQWIPEEKIVGWFSQLSLALAFIHEKKPSILHRDVKPENVFLTHEGSCVKLGDFGFTRTLANTMELALTRCGTPYYLSPEHCMNKAYNAKADVWAAGVVLYELLTLQVPFKGKNILELRNNILRAPLKRPAAHYSKETCSLLLKMLSREPELRPKMREVVSTPILQSYLRKFLANYNNGNIERGNTSVKRTYASMGVEKGPMPVRKPPKGPSPTKRSISEPLKSDVVQDTTSTFIKHLENERLSILSQMNTSRNKLMSLRQKRPREKGSHSKLRRESSDPVNPARHRNLQTKVRTFVKPRGSPPRRGLKKGSKLFPKKPNRALVVGTCDNNQSFVSNPSPQMKRMRSDSPAMKFKEYGHDLNTEDNLVNSINDLKAALLEKELKLHHIRQSQNFDDDMRGMQNVFRSSLVEAITISQERPGDSEKTYDFSTNMPRTRKSTSSNDYSDDFELEDGNGSDSISNSDGAKVSVAPIDNLDYGSDEEDIEFRNQVSELGKSVFQMTVDDDEMDIQASGKFLMSGNSTLVHQGANPDNVLDTSVDRDLFHSLSSDFLDHDAQSDNVGNLTGAGSKMSSSDFYPPDNHGRRISQQPPASPKARGNGINALRRLKQSGKSQRYGRK